MNLEFTTEIRVNVAGVTLAFQDGNTVYLVLESGQFMTLNLRSRQISVRKRDCKQLAHLLGVPRLIEQLVEENGNYFKVMSRKDLNMLDFENY